MRLDDDIALLERAENIASKAIWHSGNNVAVPARTFHEVIEQLERARISPADYRLIRDEAVWLLQAARNVTLYRDDGNAPMLERWLLIARLMRAAIDTDLVNARKSRGAI